jgi:hypothetical protein
VTAEKVGAWAETCHRKAGRTLWVKVTVDRGLLECGSMLCLRTKKLHGVPGSTGVMVAMATVNSTSNTTTVTPTSEDSWQESASYPWLQNLSSRDLKRRESYKRGWCEIGKLTKQIPKAFTEILFKSLNIVTLLTSEHKAINRHHSRGRHPIRLPFYGLEDSKLRRKKISCSEEHQKILNFYVVFVIVKFWM